MCFNGPESYTSRVNLVVRPPVLDRSKDRGWTNIGNLFPEVKTGLHKANIST